MEVGNILIKKNLIFIISVSLKEFSQKYIPTGSQLQIESDFFLS